MMQRFVFTKEMTTAAGMLFYAAVLLFYFPMIKILLVCCTLRVIVQLQLRHEITE